MGVPAGSEPHIPVLLNSVKTSRAAMPLSSAGMVPESSLSLSSRLVKAVRRPSSVGRYPVMALLSRYLSTGRNVLSVGARAARAVLAPEGHTPRPTRNREGAYKSLSLCRLPSSVGSGWDKRFSAIARYVRCVNMPISVGMKYLMCWLLRILRQHRQVSAQMKMKMDGSLR